MDQRGRLLEVLRLRKVDRAPCVCPMQTATLALMTSSGAFWPKANDDPGLMAKLASAAQEIAGLESVRVPFEISVDASAFGATTGDRRLGRGPIILSNRVPKRQDFEAMEIPDPTKAGKVPVVLESIRILKAKKTEAPIICGMVSPHMLAFQLIGDQRAMMDMFQDPVFLKAVMHKAKSFAIAYAIAAYDAGADVIAMVDAYASGDFLSPAEYIEFAMPYQAKVCKEVEKLGIPLILHICGNTTGILPYMVNTGANGISVDHEVELTFAKSVCHGKAAVLGNICATTTLLKGTPSEVTSAVMRSLEAGTDAVAPGCGLALETPLENLKAMAAATRRFGSRER